MFELAADEISPSEISDALGEIANMMGGNVKALLPGPATLSLPSVTEGSDYSITVPGAALACELHLECEGEPLSVRVHRRLEAAGA
jgi:chemotaxis protein CheX